VVNEIPSFHLEFFNETTRHPETAVITNIFQDHLNRYKTFNDYVKTKSDIFKNQAGLQNLILNYDNKWTPFLLKQKPKAQVWFFSMKPLPAKISGVFYKDNSIYLKSTRSSEKVLDVTGFADKWGEHNLQNLMTSALIAHLHGVFWSEIQTKMLSLPQIPFRQEVVFTSPKLKIVNDTTATSPDGGVAAVKRFCGKDCILITGGTDRQLEYTDWGKAVLKHLKPENIVMLAGSATTKMLKALGRAADKIHVSDTLVECIRLALDKAGKYEKSVVVFSPAAKSFEKFKNEYDRGEQFNALVKKETKNERGSR
jgi:UDP-N-acetylmuramoylalanine--D-glutamate ligase